MAKSLLFALLASAGLMTAAAPAAAAPKSLTLPENRAKLTHNGSYLDVMIHMDFTDLKVSSTQALVMTPYLVNGVDTLRLHPVEIAGRRRQTYFERTRKYPVDAATTTFIKASEMPSGLDYKQSVDYRPWMNGATLDIRYECLACCNKTYTDLAQNVAGFDEYVPMFVYMQPPKVDAEKSRSLSGQAYVDFPVNQTVIYPDYRNNTAELAKINASIDSVHGDKDITINQVWLKGYASPESPYQHNADLAAGRVDALHDYVDKRYRFPAGTIVTEYEPEDWEGLRRFVANSGLKNKQPILAIIDSNMDPDKKEAELKSKYLNDFIFMLHDWFPALRRTDYRIDYTIRSYLDPVEIAQVMATAPQKLSLDEFYVLSNSYEPGTDEFSEVWETAVRMYPDNEIANLNAGINALQRGDYPSAARYLAKAGDSTNAAEAREILSKLSANY